MLAKAKIIASSDLVKVSFLNTIATVVRMLTGLISVKVVATIIGPPGIALLGQLNNFSSVVLSLANGGISAGMTKYIAENAENDQNFSTYLSTGFKITITLSIITSLVLILGSGYFSRSLLLSPDYKVVFIIFGLTLIFFSLNTLITSIINGFREYKKYVIVNIAGSLIGLLFSVILALKYGLYGALISSVTFQSVVFIITIALVSKSFWLKWKYFNGKLDPLVLKKLSAYSLMAITSALTVPTSQLLVRKYITQFSGINSAGLWEGLNRISGMYLMVITTSLGVYFLPNFAKLKTNLEIRIEIQKIYKLLIPILLVLTASIFIFRKLIVNILFSKEFFAMESLFTYQLIGDFLKISGWVLGYLLLAKAMTRTYIFMEMLNFVLLAIFCFFLTKYYGTIGATIGYTLVYLIYLIILLIKFRKIIFNKISET